MIIDIHGHYTTEPAALHRFRERQVKGELDFGATARDLDLRISDAEIIASVQPQLALQRARGSDLTLFSPRAAGMGHHVGTEAVGRDWARLSNDMIHRVCRLLPDNFAPVGQLPQVSGISPSNCLPELERIASLGFVGVNLNPDPSGGYWREPPLTDRHWYPLYEKLVELEMPAMIHVSGSCNPAFHHTGAHYINADTTAFMQLLLGDLFHDFPQLKIVIPHGGGAVPYHWGRYRGLAMMLKKPTLARHLLDNVFFDTCVYHLPGMALLTQVVPADNILFGSEMLGAVRDIDPETGHHFDDTRRYIEQIHSLSHADRHKVFAGNARRVYPRLNRFLDSRAQFNPTDRSADVSSAS